MNKYQKTITQISVHLESESPIYGASTVTVELDDEAAGIFLVIKPSQSELLSIDIDQWRALNDAVEFLLDQKCQGMP